MMTTTSIHFVLHRLTSVTVGGGTPLDQGLLMVGRMIRQWHARYPAIDLIVISDGRSTGSLAEPNVSASLALIRKFVRKALVINPIPVADRFARSFAALIGAKHFTTMKHRKNLNNDVLDIYSYAGKNILLSIVLT